MHLLRNQYNEITSIYLKYFRVIEETEQEAEKIVEDTNSKVYPQQFEHDCPCYTTNGLNKK